MTGLRKVADAYVGNDLPAPQPFNWVRFVKWASLTVGVGMFVLIIVLASSVLG